MAKPTSHLDLPTPVIKTPKPDPSLNRFVFSGSIQALKNAFQKDALSSSSDWLALNIALKKFENRDCINDLPDDG